MVGVIERHGYQIIIEDDGGNLVLTWKPHYIILERNGQKEKIYYYNDEIMRKLRNAIVTADGEQGVKDIMNMLNTIYNDVDSKVKQYVAQLVDGVEKISKSQKRYLIVLKDRDDLTEYLVRCIDDYIALKESVKNA